MFRDKVIAEAVAQSELRKAGQPIPAHLRRYARLSGVLTAAVTGSGAIIIVALGYYFGTLYWFAALFMVLLAVIGLIQAVLGRHILSSR